MPYTTSGIPCTQKAPKDMKLYVDDLRRCPEGWKLSRTITDAISHLFNGRVREVSLDHDICYIRGTDIRMHKENFMPVCYVLCLLPPERRPTKVRIHTANVDAGWKMVNLLEKAGYTNVEYVLGGDECTQEDVNRIKGEI